MVQRRGIKQHHVFNNWPVVIFLLAIAFHFATLHLYPFPWFDEAFFASITHSFIQEGTFIPDVVRVVKGNNESLAYGPVYFWLTSLWIKITSFSAYNFRMVSLLFGIFTTLILWRITKSKLALLLIIDPFFSIGLHHARMETTAIFFVLLSIVCFQNKKMEMGAIWFSVAFLTTPRIFFFLPAILVYLLMEKNDFKKIVFSLFIFLSIYVVWVFAKHGSIQNWFNYYLKVIGGNNTAATGFIGANFYIPKHEFLLIGITTLSIFLNFFFKKRLSSLSIFGIVAIFSFYFLITDWGYYSVLILPIYYLILLGNLSDIEIRWKVILCTLLLTFNGVYLCYKISNILHTNYEEISASEKHVLSIIPTGSKVVGSARFYYLMKNHLCDYQLHDKYANAATCVEKLTTDFGYDYLIVEPKNAYLPYFLEKNKHELLYHFDGKFTEGLIFEESSSFVVYRRINEI